MAKKCVIVQESVCFIAIERCTNTDQ